MYDNVILTLQEELEAIKKERREYHPPIPRSQKKVKALDSLIIQFENAIKELQKTCA